MNEPTNASFSRRTLEAGLEGLPLIVQGIGTMTKSLKAYGAGVALNGLVGLKQTVDESQRFLEIYWHPDQINPKPNYFRLGSGLLNVAGAAAYGASSTGLLSAYVGGAGAIAQGISYYSTQLLPQDAGMYYPALPSHGPAPSTPATPAPSPDRPVTPDPPSPNAAIAQAARAHLPARDGAESVRGREAGERRADSPRPGVPYSRPASVVSRATASQRSRSPLGR
ncbi:hypothetical protein [Streptomyces axinellae]|uniref:Uncharacterized protein n=1 Tax=Streptomyces axinellae TaxID=552788 RepID=A0ABN3QXA2_9ACTN